MDTLQESPMLLLISFGKIHLPGRERGFIESTEKCKSLLQRWYGQKKVEKEKTLERGSIITLEELPSSIKDVITAVFKVDGKT